MERYWGFVIVLASWLSGGLASPGAAQSTTGTMHGTVKDSTGAVLPGASLSVVNVDTNVARLPTTNAVGEFKVDFLPVGIYRVEVMLGGFKRSIRTGVVVELNRAARVDTVLEIGAVIENVEVRADPRLADTTRSTLGRTVTDEELLNLPLVDRDPYGLLDLTPGVDSSRSTNIFGSPGQETLVNGSANAGSGAVNYNLDGGANVSGLRNTGNVVPNPDAVREFRVVTNNYSAEYGRFAGGVVDVVTKSGTNRLKGSLFEFFRNDALNANRWTVEESSLKRDPLQRNNFGGSLGGPILRDRTFFFGSYNGLRQTTTVFKNDAHVPTPDERAGDFSRSADKPFDPLTGQPFPGGLIPSVRFDAAAVRILNDYVPLANLPGNLYEVQETAPETRHEVTLKIDHQLTKTQRLTGSYFSSRGDRIEKLRGNLPWSNREFSWNQQNVNAAHTWVMRSNAVNEGRVTYVRNFGGRLNTPEIALDDLNSSYRTQGPRSLPDITVNRYFLLTSAIAGPVAGSHLTQLRDTLSLSRGQHSIRVGSSRVDLQACKLEYSIVSPK